MKNILNFLGAIALSVAVSLLLKNHLNESVRYGISSFVMFEAMFPIIKHSIIKRKKESNKLSPLVLLLKYSIGAIVGGIGTGFIFSLHK